MNIYGEKILDEILVSCIPSRKRLIIRIIINLVIILAYIYIVYFLFGINGGKGISSSFPLIIPIAIIRRDIFPDGYDGYIVTKNEIIFFSQTIIPKRVLHISFKSLIKIETGNSLSTQIFRFKDHKDVFFIIRNSKSFTAACIKTEELISGYSKK